MLIEIINSDRKVSIVGIGNELIVEDSFGIKALEKLLNTKLAKRENIQLLLTYTVPENFLGKIMKFEPEIVLFIDTLRLPNYEDYEEVVLFDLENFVDKSFGTHKLSVNHLIKVLGSKIQPEYYLFAVNINRIIKQNIKDYDSYYDNLISNLFNFN
jgi:hydrogenase 3 maturation protease